MPAPVQLVLGVAALVGLAGLFLFGRRLVHAWLAYRGTRVVVCPENAGDGRGRGRRATRAVDRAAGPAAAAARVVHALAGGRTAARSASGRSSRRPRRACCATSWPTGTGQELRLLRPRVRHDRTGTTTSPGSLATDGTVVAWTGFPPEQVLDVLATHQPVCWDCRVAESFRREHPELVTDRPAAARPAALDGLALPAAGPTRSPPDRGAVGGPPIAAALEQSGRAGSRGSPRRRPARRSRTSSWPAPASASIVSAEKPFLSNSITVGQPLVVEARGVDGLLRVHAEVDHVQDGEQDRVHDRAAAGAAGDEIEAGRPSPGSSASCSRASACRARRGSARVPMRPVASVRPGPALKSPISLLSRKPAPGTTIFEP